MAWQKRREIPIVLAAGFGISQLVEYYYSDPTLSLLATTGRNWALIIASIAVGVGAVVLISQWVRPLLRRSKEWPFFLWGLVLLAVTIIAGLLPPLGTNQYVTWIYNSIFQPVSATLFATLAFFIFSAAFRSFRTRTKEATLMLIAAFLVMLRNAPALQASWPGFTVISDWIFNVPTKAGERAILIGAAVGIILLGLRIFTGRERAVMGEALSGGAA
jgi:hypothetical protein